LPLFCHFSGWRSLSANPPSDQKLPHPNPPRPNPRSGAAASICRRCLPCSAWGLEPGRERTGTAAGLGRAGRCDGSLPARVNAAPAP
jgi:hypothetical protein